MLVVCLPGCDLIDTGGNKGKADVINVSKDEGSTGLLLDLISFHVQILTLEGDFYSYLLKFICDHCIT